MKTYKVKAQGYGGGGPSVDSFESLDLNEIKSEIEDLISSDHAVQLYRVEDDGTEVKIPFEYYTYVKCTIDIPEERDTIKKQSIGNLCSESVTIDSDGYIVWEGGDRPVSEEAIVAVKVRSGIPRDPIQAKHWPQVCWRQRDKTDPKSEWDIVAYKVMK